jgi:hypothetical protein
LQAISCVVGKSNNESRYLNDDVHHVDGGDGRVLKNDAFLKIISQLLVIYTRRPKLFFRSSNFLSIVAVAQGIN